MDPNATLREIESLIQLICDEHDFHLRDEQQGEAAEHCENLRNWIRKGGFEPDWDKCPSAKGYYLALEAVS